jgi:hypothetical protein
MGWTTPLDGNRISFILSAGRTGTSFLAAVCPALVPGRAFLQEAPPARRIFMLSNAAAAGLVPADWAERLFLRDRARRLARAAGEIVEINPFLVPLAPRLAELVRPLRIVHMVRDPRSWIHSMANFKAAGWRRPLIDWVPFAQTVHPAARPEWRRLDPIRRYAWRWRLANEQIEAAREGAAHYALVRYEDLFGGDWAARCAALRRVLGLWHAKDRCDAAVIPWETAVNASRERELAAWERWPAAARRDAAAIVAPLMPRYGYDAAAAPPRLRQGAP